MVKKNSKNKDNKSTHLIVRQDGSLAWDWDVLLQEVRTATADIVTVTEAAVKKTRKQQHVHK